MDKNGNGVCIFAYNNEQLDYAKFASVVSKFVKRNMKNNQVALITNEGTENWMKQSLSQQTIDYCFDYVIITKDEHISNPRVHHDSPWSEFTAQFQNSNKHKVIEYTPFERTLLIDTDFIVQNNFYDYIFETNTPVAMHRTAEYLGGELPYQDEMMLNRAGINHWWSTVVYFDQSEHSKMFFDIWSHVKDNWEYYSLLYQFPKSLFRTDFCVSIASHMINGFQNEVFMDDFKSTPLLNMDQKDDIVKLNSLNDFVFLKHNRLEAWKNILCRHTNTNMHLMNKRAFDRQIENINTMFEENSSV
tara:strand:+ start:12862 stop:13767 length:906 start_codon:yes stop_codon:yes gene_type:complete